MTPVLLRVDEESVMAFKISDFPVIWVGSCEKCGKEPTYLVLFKNRTWKLLCWDCILASNEDRVKEFSVEKSNV